MTESCAPCRATSPNTPRPTVCVISSATSPPSRQGSSPRHRSCANFSAAHHSNIDCPQHQLPLWHQFPQRHRLPIRPIRLIRLISPIRPIGPIFYESPYQAYQAYQAHFLIATLIRPIRLIRPILPQNPLTPINQPTTKIPLKLFIQKVLNQC